MDAIWYHNVLIFLKSETEPIYSIFKLLICV